MTPHARDITKQVCDKYSVRLDDLVGRSRRKALIVPRAELFWRLYHEGGMTMGDIARWSGRDHSSVSHLVYRHAPLQIEHKEKLVTDALRADLARQMRREADQRKREQKTKPKPDHVEKKRKCLGCQRPFRSRSFGERLCAPCKRGRAWKSGNDYTVTELST